MNKTQTNRLKGDTLSVKKAGLLEGKNPQVKYYIYSIIELIEVR